MTQITLIDNALVSLLESCALPSTTVLSSPHAWDQGYFQRLLTITPAVLVSWGGAEPFGDQSTSLQLLGKWSVTVAAGWNGADQKARRLGAGSGFDLMHRVGAAIHNATLKEPNGDDLPQTRVVGMGVMTDSAVDLVNLWVGEIDVEVNLDLELLETDQCYGPLDDFLKIRGPLVLPDPADDLQLAIDLEQT